MVDVNLSAFSVYLKGKDRNLQQLKQLRGEVEPLVTQLLVISFGVLI